MTPVGAIEGSALGHAMRQWLWLYPSVEIVHVVGIALLFGSIAVVDLRLLGFGRTIPVRALAGHVLPWTAASFVLIVPSGLLMFIAHASEFITNPVFVMKMCLIMAAGVNAGLFHATAFRSAEVWDAPGLRTPPSVRAFAAVSLAIWISVIACGRLLAYF
jgi:hypothetical protein